MGTILLILFIIFFVIPIVRIAIAAYIMRKKMRDTMKEMFEAQQKQSQQGEQRQQRKAGWSAPMPRRKKIGGDIGEYVKFEDIPVQPTDNGDGAKRSQAPAEPQITDAEWEDIK